MDVASGGDDGPENGLAGHDTLSHDDLRLDVLVLEGATVVARDYDSLALDLLHNAGGDRINGRAVGRGDVDALMERERAGAGHEAGQGWLGVEISARIAEGAADRVLLIERRHGPSVRALTAGLRAGGARRIRVQPTEARSRDNEERSCPRENRSACSARRDRHGESLGAVAKHHLSGR